MSHEHAVLCCTRTRIDENDTLMVADSEEDSHTSDTKSESSEHVDLDKNLILY
jgi:hypothetical protein